MSLSASITPAPELSGKMVFPSNVLRRNDAMPLPDTYTVLSPSKSANVDPAALVALLSLRRRPIDARNHVDYLFFSRVFKCRDGAIMDTFFCYSMPLAPVVPCRS